MLANNAGDNVPALTTTATWDMFLRIAERPLFPRGAFAVYYLGSTWDGEEEGEKGKVLEVLNGGFAGRKKLPPREGDREHVCVSAAAAAVEGQEDARQLEDIKDVRARHQRLAKEKQGRKGGGPFHPGYFIAVSKEDWATRNVVLVDLEGGEGGGTELSLAAETVGELVQWIWVGLTSTDEVVRASRDGVIGPEELFVESVEGE